MKKIIVLSYIATAVLPISGQCADSVLPRLKTLAEYYDFTAINLNQCTDTDSAVLILDGALIATIECNGNAYAVFIGCDTGKYEMGRGKESVIIYRYPGDPAIPTFFKEFCQACPTISGSDGTVYRGAITTDYSTHRGKMTDCRIPVNTSIKDVNGTYTFTNDCYYTE